jgi:glyoxylase-like metal-dependent hydrolase (beta-lactamase superfamily II)
MIASEQFELFALRYATDPTWRRGKSYVHDPKPDERITMDFFFWLARSRNRTILIDTGCSNERLKFMKHELVRPPLEGLKSLNVRPEDVDDVIVSHLHYDHVGNAAKFPRAILHLQQRELDFVAGPYMKYACFNRPYFADDIGFVIDRTRENKVRLYDGDATLFPGFSIHLVGGHTMGMQITRVFTKRGWVVLASDALHYYQEIERDLPWSSNAFHIGDMMEAHDKIRALADSADHIIPAHDPRVLEDYPAIATDIVRLDVSPRSAA